jgi:signal transduction histidine kinase
VLNVSRIHDPIPLSDDQMGVLCVFAEQIGVLIEQASVLDELRVKASALERDNTRLMEFAQIRDVFLSTASHELRTPLTSVIAYAELLSDHNGRLGQEDQAEFLNRLKTEAKRLHALVENILDLTQLETGKVQLNLQETGINHVVRSAVETSAVMAGKLNVRIEENYEPKEKPVSLDEVKIRQVVINLLTNAIRFSPEGGSVRISTMCSGAQMVVSVTDDGPGVPGNDLQGIFALFDQGLRKSSTNSSGLGIGLYIAKQIVELHDGKVGVDTKPGKGSTFWVRLPISNRSAGVDERAA